MLSWHFIPAAAVSLKQGWVRRKVSSLVNFLLFALIRRTEVTVRTEAGGEGRVRHVTVAALSMVDRRL